MLENYLNRYDFRKWFARIYLSVIFASIFTTQVKSSMQGGSPYQTGDWLINYSGGFVRRGLFGELFLSIPISGAIGLWMLNLIQISMYCFLLAFGYRMIRREQFSWLAILVWLGPATLGFFAWDSGSPFWKEILCYLVILLLIAARDNSSKPVRTFFNVLAILCYVLATFSWEPSALFLPILIFLVWTNPNLEEEQLKRVSLVIAFIGIGLSGAIASVFFHGDAVTSSIICESIRSKGYLGTQLCLGSINAIGWSSSYTFNLVQQSYPLYFGYLAVLPLTFAPIVYALKDGKHRLWALVVLVSFIPLFVIVPDYGRWMSMAAISLAFLTTTFRSLPALRIKRLPILSVGYLSLWGIPYWIDPSGSWPWLGLLSSCVKFVFRVLS
jgi:hypothetical protein